ncbi:MBL fold metallo-hydrolase [Haemophilus paracuniculus]|uniref:MBL fold metallo-hydrolase n=1 Tax=Haemophilus paracuniculus TaxID=734 RepID=A0A1T0ASI5_9PAST|nr:MBL fold metallo-hydrolase [Haemophilus paracuniculus]OOR99185.1 MBL fold metallo-hydrolase [Haemophilus paracuniculus]
MKKTILTSLVAAALGLVTLPAVAQPAFTPAKNAVPQLKTQVPGYFRTMVGDFEVTALYDGSGNLDTSLFTRFTQLSQADLEKMLDDAFSPRTYTGAAEGAIIAFLINTGDNLILVDSGKGEVEAEMFLDKKGRLLDSLNAAGYKPEQIDIILPTHLHADHINGVVANGKMAFPNATIYLPNQEKAFWLDSPISQLPAEIQPLVQLARSAVEPYLKADRVKFYNAGEEVFPNVKSIPLFGHTPGHNGFEFSSKGETLLVWGDLMHNQVIQMAHPEVAIEFDANAEAARQTRLAMLPKIAERKLLVAAAHLPFPGLGHIRQEKEGYRWMPIEYRLIR